MALGVRSEAGRYSGALTAIHWLTAALMFAVIPVGWQMMSLAKTDPARPWWFTLHKSIGLVILALAIGRVAARALHPPPPEPGWLSGTERALARATHVMLYVALFAMPVSGYLVSYAGNHPVNWFWLFRVPALVGVSKPLEHYSAIAHLAGQWVVYALLVLHVAGALNHLLIRRDGVFQRMWPAR